jgi:acetyltransferase-like isoleucine patch superfamily enzyme
MSADSEITFRIIKAVHGKQEVKKDPDFEIGLADHLKGKYGRERLAEIYARFESGEEELDQLMRRAIWRAVAKKFGHAVKIGTGVGFKHLETFEIGSSVFIGSQSYIQGRFDGTCLIGDHVWIGPQSYFDARHLVMEEYVGWGPGAKVLGSTHTGSPIDIPIIQTDLEMKSVRIGAWADIGMNAVVLPGVVIGRGSIVGAGSVVTKDTPPFSVVAGSPAKFIKWREGYTAEGINENKE